jgi:hypothetical protein
MAIAVCQRIPPCQAEKDAAVLGMAKATDGLQPLPTKGLRHRRCQPPPPTLLTTSRPFDIFKISNFKGAKNESCSSPDRFPLSPARQRNWRDPHNDQTSG